MKKVCIVMIGAIRNENDILENIRITKSNFKDCEVSVLFSTWNPKREEYNFCGVNYVYDYNKEELEDSLRGLVDFSLFLNQKSLDEYNKCNDSVFKSPFRFIPIFIYQLIEVSKYIKENNLKFDYIVKTRNDTAIELNNAEKYLNNKINVPPIYWVPGTKYFEDSINDHFFVTDFENFQKFAEISDDKLTQYCNDSRSGENINFNILKDFGEISYIDETDIKLYINRNKKFI